MSQANVELVRGVYEAFGSGDVDAVFAAMAPDIEWDESEGMPYGGVYRGREAIVENVFGPILADVEEFTADPDEILWLDDRPRDGQRPARRQWCARPGRCPLRPHLDGHRRQGIAVRAARRHPSVLRCRRQVTPSDLGCRRRTPD